MNQLGWGQKTIFERSVISSKLVFFFLSDCFRVSVLHYLEASTYSESVKPQQQHPKQKASLINQSTVGGTSLKETQRRGRGERRQWPMTQLVARWESTDAYSRVKQPLSLQVDHNKAAPRPLCAAPDTPRPDMAF